MDRVDVLRALSAARDAFRQELKKRGIEVTNWDPDNPGTRSLFVLVDGGVSAKVVGEISYRQKVRRDLK